MTLHRVEDGEHAAFLGLGARLMLANQEYYLTYLRPRAMIRPTLTIALGRPGLIV